MVGAAVAFALAMGGQAQAAGCLSGAAVGGLAGHAVHHGVLGAAGGCAVGHHMAKKHQRQAAEQQQGEATQQPDGRGTSR
jgi:hypothetical protein